MKSTNINIRVPVDFKNALIIEAKKHELGMSEYAYRTLKEKMDLDYLTESQEQFAQTFEIIFKKVYEPYFKRQMVIENKINFFTRWIIRVLNLFLKNVSVPQDKEKVLTSFIDHPILDIANEEVLKEIRTLKQKKETIEDEFE